MSDQDVKTDVKNKNPRVEFILKENQSEEGQKVATMEYPFSALGGLPVVGDLIKLEDGITYRIYLRHYDYEDIDVQIKISIFIIKVDQ